MTEEKQERLLQWIKGDNAGTIETIIGEDGDWIKFQSGRRINSSLVSEFMINATQGALDPNDLQLAVTASPTPPPPIPIPGLVKEQNPIETLIKKSSKVYHDQISISITLTLPTPELVSFISDSFGEEETMACVKKYINDQVSIDSVKAAIGESIDEFIEESYS